MTVVPGVVAYSKSPFGIYTLKTKVSAVSMIQRTARMNVKGKGMRFLQSSL
jgi:hypothetical protein